MNGKLLIVDDEQEIREMLSRHFQMLGYVVDTAENGRDALNTMEDKRFDVVISDIMMPEMDGVSLLREIRNHYPMVRIIMITGYVNLENVFACMRNQADTCVFKPLNDLTELEDAVENAIVGMNRWNDKLRELRGMEPTREYNEQS